MGLESRFVARPPLTQTHSYSVGLGLTIWLTVPTPGTCSDAGVMFQRQSAVCQLLHFQRGWISPAPRTCSSASSHLAVELTPERAVVTTSPRLNATAVRPPKVVV